MNHSGQHLDAERLFLLGMQASAEGQHYEAIVQLELSLEKKPDVKTYYLLAAEYAEIGMYENAVKGLQTVIELDQEFWIAYYQLGLLYLMQDQAAAAIQAWEVLKTLDETYPLHSIGTGMIHLVTDNFDEAAKYLEKGISCISADPYLNEEIESLLNKIQAAKNEITDVTDNKPSWRLFFLPETKTPVEQ